jgi:hypothetical protein
MVKVLAPAMSMEASGQIGGVMVFSRWKGRAYARSLVKPANPRTGNQTGIRAMLRFLSQDWKNLDAETQGSWEDLAKATNISPFNSYIAHNIRRWREFLPPTQAYPAAGLSTPLEEEMTLTTGQRCITITLSEKNTVYTNIWGHVLMRDTAAITTPNFNLAIQIFPEPVGHIINYVDAPLAAGTYHYRAAIFNVDGVISDFCADQDEDAT